MFLSGCSNFTVNAAMCDKIASDPNAVVPEECRVYNEEEATKAFNKEKNKEFNPEDSVEFNK
ncbi:hypothetical protein FJR48_11770 [Sulfurimonas lithotrophica]|uniref:Uncharacterized protein n=2 Tax=Sulfurimonas lithotrophica TaxID=2590022 RepID=A0A5P8P498_9BACT|nr:hypothetical protein FJR48_11770 [Sulfurimonas lithotrophica]